MPLELDSPESLYKNLPATKFKTIYCDPPWDYGPRARCLCSIKIPYTREYYKLRLANSITVPLPYPTLTIPQLKLLPIPDLAEKGCHLYLWTTNRFIHEAFHLLTHWGFRHPTVLTWSKPPKGIYGGTYVISHEFLLFCRNGTAPAKCKHRGTVFNLGRFNITAKTPHAHKPVEFYPIIESVSPGPYLELFSRNTRPGWTSWGNEILP